MLPGLVLAGQGFEILKSNATSLVEKVVGLPGTLSKVSTTVKSVVAVTKSWVIEKAIMLKQQAASAVLWAKTNGLMMAGIALQKVKIVLTKAWGVAMNAAMGPIGWIALGITAIIAGFKLLYDNCKPFRDAVDQVLESVKQIPDYLAMAWEWIKEMAGKIWGIAESIFSIFSSGEKLGNIKAPDLKTDQLESSVNVIFYSLHFS